MSKFVSPSTLCFPKESHRLAELVHKSATEVSWSTDALTALVNDYLSERLPGLPALAKTDFNKQVLCQIVELELLSLKLVGLIMVTGSSSPSQRENKARDFAGGLNSHVHARHNDNKTAIGVDLEDSERRCHFDALPWDKLCTLVELGANSGSHRVKLIALRTLRR